MQTANETSEIGNINDWLIPKLESIFVSSGFMEFVNPDQECLAFRKTVMATKIPLMIFMVLVFNRFQHFVSWFTQHI